MEKIIETPHAPSVIGPYSQAIRFGDLVALSGQLPIHPETGDVAEKLKSGTQSCGQ